MMRYVIIIEQGPTSYGAYVPDLPGCVAVGETADEVRALIQEAILLHVESLRADGLAVPPPTSQSEYIEIPLAA
jgi:predicted RNase H-like HicB family nuclease